MAALPTPVQARPSVGRVVTPGQARPDGDTDADIRPDGDTDTEEMVSELASEPRSKIRRADGTQRTASALPSWVRRLLCPAPLLRAACCARDVPPDRYLSGRWIFFRPGTYVDAYEGFRFDPCGKCGGVLKPDVVFFGALC